MAELHLEKEPVGQSTTQDERLSMDFNVEPEQGIELHPLPQKELEDAMPQETEREATEEVSEESTESQTDEEEMEIQAQDESLDMSIGQFANAAGVTLKDIYGLTMPDGRTLSQAVDEGKEQSTTIQNLQGEVNQLQRQLQEASNAPPLDAEAMKLEAQAELFQAQLDNADFSQIDDGKAANLRLSYMQEIQRLKEQAQAKRNQSNGKMQEKAQEALIAANRDLMGKIPTWNSQDVYMRDNKAMGDFLRTRGFSDWDLFAIDRNPGIKHLVYDAWKAMAKQEEIKQGAKRVRKVSKTLSPGAMSGTRGKPSLKEVGKEINKGETRQDRQRRRLTAEFDL